jgi:hypothetical protein
MAPHLQSRLCSTRMGTLSSLQNLQEVSVEGYETVRFARAINDGISNGYPPIDVLAEAFCRHGTGRALVEVQAEASLASKWWRKSVQVVKKCRSHLLKKSDFLRINVAWLQIEMDERAIGCPRFTRQ